MLKKTLLALAFTSLAVAAFAQQTGIKRTPLQKVEFPDGYNTVTAIAEVPAGGAAGRHTHPGVETGYVLEGELNLLIDGQPEKTLKAGGFLSDPGRRRARRQGSWRQGHESAWSLHRRQDQAAGFAGALMRQTDRPQAGWFVLEHAASGPPARCTYFSPQEPKDPCAGRPRPFRCRAA